MTSQWVYLSDLEFFRPHLGRVYLPVDISLEEK